MAKQDTSKGINLKFPLRSYYKGFFETNRTTLDAVREDIKTLLLTRRGERVINTTLGTNLPLFSGQLFEQIQPFEMKEQIKSEIIAALEEWMPHVILRNIRIETIEDNGDLKDTEILVIMDYILQNAEALGDSVQLRITSA